MINFNTIFGIDKPINPKDETMKGLNMTVTTTANTIEAALGTKSQTLSDLNVEIENRVHFLGNDISIIEKGISDIDAIIADLEKKKNDLLSKRDLLSKDKETLSSTLALVQDISNKLNPPVIAVSSILVNPPVIAVSNDQLNGAETVTTGVVTQTPAS